MKSGDPSHAHTALRMEAPPAPQPRVLPVSSATPASLSRYPLQRDPCPGLGTPLQGGRSRCGCRGWVTSSLTPPLRGLGHVGWDGQCPSPTGAGRQEPHGASVVTAHVVTNAAKKLFLLIPPPSGLWPTERPARQRAGALRPTRQSAFPCSPHSPEARAAEVSRGLWPRWPGVGAALPEDSSTSSVYCREPSPWRRTNPSGSLSSSSEGGPPASTAPGRCAQAARLLLQQGCSSSLSPFSGTGHQAAPGARSRSKGSSSRKQLSSSVRQPRISVDISVRTDLARWAPVGVVSRRGHRTPRPLLHRQAGALLRTLRWDVLGDTLNRAQ